MKKFNTIIIALLTYALLFMSCADNKSKRIGDLIDFPDELPAEIIVYGDDPSGEFKKTTNKDAIKKIVEFYKNRSYIKTDTPAPGSNASVELKYADGKTIKLSANAITGKNGKIYVSSMMNDGLAALIEDIIGGNEN